MDSWLDSLEAWLLECSEVCPSSSEAAGAVVHLQPPSVLPPPGESAAGLSEEQTQQLLAACGTHDEKLLTALFSLFEERHKHPDQVEQALRQLFVLARCRVAKLRLFALQFTPTLIYLDLLALSQGDNKFSSSVELVLLALYNCEVLNETGLFRLPSYRLPTLARQSIYHEPASLGPASFSTDSLVRYEHSEERLPPLPAVTLPVPCPVSSVTGPAPLHNAAIREGSMSSNSNSSGGGAGSNMNRKNSSCGPAISGQHLAGVTAATRSAVLASVMASFNATITSLHRCVLLQLCKYTSRIVTHGLPRCGSHQQRSSYSDTSSIGGGGGGAPNGGMVPALSTPRLSLSSDLLLQLVLAAYAAVHKLGDHTLAPEPATNGDAPPTTATRNKRNSLPSLHHPHHHRHHKRSRSSGGSECVCVAIQAIEDIQLRCEADLLPDLLHLCYAVTHSLRHDNIINGEGSDSPPLVSVPPPPSTPLAKTCITNASFRTKKLPEDIPVQPTEGAMPGDPSKVLVSISEDADGEGREDGAPSESAAPSMGAGAKLAGILRREGRDSKEGRESGRFGNKDKDGSKDGEGSKEKSSSKFTPTKFSSGNIAIPGLKRKDKDKTRNGEKKEKENVNISDESRKSDKRERMKERSNGLANGSSNRNSGVYSSSEGGGDVTDYYSGSEEVSPTKGTGKSGKHHKEQEQIQLLIEMKNMARPSSSSASSSLHDPQQGSPQVLHNSAVSSAVQQLKQQDSASLSDSLSSSSLLLDFRKGSSDGQPEYRNMDSVESTDI